MTTNEQIAGVMGWDKVGSMIYIKSENRYVAVEFLVDVFLSELPAAKLLQQRMVDDGWHFELAHWIESFPDFPPRTYLSATACNFGGRKPDLIFAEADTEPAAIVSLFKKVYGIEVEHE